MADVQKATLAASALEEGIPERAVYLRCRNWGLLPSRARDLAESAAAEAYLRALDVDLPTEIYYRRWVTRVALNFAVDELRRMRRHHSLDDEDPQAPAEKASSLDIGRLLIAIDSLPELERHIIKLSWFSEQKVTLDDIARTLLPDDKRSPNAKRIEIKRKRDVALALLRVYLNHDHDGGEIS